MRAQDNVVLMSQNVVIAIPVTERGDELVDAINTPNQTSRRALGAGSAPPRPAPVQQRVAFELWT